MGTTPRQDEFRLGIAVSRGLLIDLLATGDIAGTTAADERFIDLWETGRTGPATG